MTTSNMNLTLPEIGVTSGSTWANNINANFQIVDAHDHLNSGKRLSSSAFVVDGDIDFKFFVAIGLGSVSFDNEATPSSLTRTLYQSNGDLYYKDHNSTAIRLTAAGALNVGSLGAITGMDATSTVSYSTVSKTYTFTQNAGVVAKISCGTLAISHESAGVQSVRLGANSGNAGYDFIFDNSAPASNKYLSFSSTSQVKYKDLLGTANQITVTHNTNDTTFSLPTTVNLTTVAATTGNITTVNSTTGNITTVAATTVGATTGNITTVNATTVNATTHSGTHSGPGSIPVGSIIPTLKGYTGAYSCTATTVADAQGFVLCAGQTIADATSPMNGQVIPDLTSGVFLRGQTVSGSMGGSSTINLAHGHSFTLQVENLPSHSHTMNHDHASVESGVENANHTHGYIDYYVGLAPINVATGSTFSAPSSLNATRSTDGVSNTHTHSVDLPNYTGSTGLAGTGTAKTTDTQLSTSQSILPPYLNVVYICRIK